MSLSTHASDRVHPIATPLRSPGATPLPPDADVDGTEERTVSPTVEGVTVALILAFALVSRLTMALFIPPWQGPDEPKHFEYPRLLVDLRARLWAERRILNLGDASPALEYQIIESMAAHRFWESIGQPTPAVLPKNFDELSGGTGRGTQLHRPSMYYFLAALPLALAQGGSLETQILVVRLVSVICSTGTVGITYLAARMLVPRDPFVSIVSAGFVAALPMHVFIGGVVNNDNLISFFGAIVTAILLRGLVRGFGAADWPAIVLFVTLALLTKRTAVGLLPGVVLAGACWVATLRLRSIVVIGVAMVVALGAGLAIVIGPLGDSVAGWPLVGRLHSMVIAYALNEPDQVQSLFTHALGSDEGRALLLEHLTLMFWSFWGIFGWFAIVLDPSIYRALMLVSGACLFGFLAWTASRLFLRSTELLRLHAAQFSIALVCLTLTATMIALAEGERLAYFDPHEIPQGRTLFVAIAPIALLHAIGARALLPRRFVGTWVPIALILLALVLLDIIAFTQAIVPFYAARPAP